jgi:heme oxygenase
MVAACQFQVMPNTTMGSAPVATLARIQTCLRESTRPSHRAIDHHPLLAPLVQPTLSLAHYQHVLTVMNWMHRALRERLTEAMAEYLPGSAFLPSDRTGWLAGDLEWFGMPNTCAPERIVDCLTLRFMSPHSLVGALYVLEGSTLGGQVITRQLAQSIQVYPGKGASFFHGHGADTAVRWNAFWQTAADVCAQGALDEVCASAVHMFEDLERVFNTCDPSRLNDHRQP